MSVGFASLGGWNLAIMSFFSSCADFFCCFGGVEVPLPFGWPFPRLAGCVAAAGAGVGGRDLSCSECEFSSVGMSLSVALIVGDGVDGSERIGLAGGG